MRSGLSRRTILKSVGASGLAAALPLRPAEAESSFSGMPGEGKDTPKICLGSGAVDEPGMRRLKQIGVDHVLTGGPKIPWTEADVRARIDQYRAGGLTLCNMMISGFDDVIWGRPGAEAQTADVIASIRAAGKAGLPVVEYNFYAHRLTEGYKEETGRAGAGYTAYDYELSKNLPPKEGVGTHTRAEQLRRAERFLKAVVPEAEKANVRLALHPNDPPVPLSRGSEQLMATVEHWKEYLRLVESPMQRHDVRLRGHAGDGRRPGGGLPLPRRARPHQPRPLPQRRGAQALRGLHGGVSRRRPGGPVRRDARARAAEVPARDLPRAPAGPRPRPRTRRASGASIRAAAASRARSTTSATRGPCCRRR